MLPRFAGHGTVKPLRGLTGRTSGLPKSSQLNEFDLTLPSVLALNLNPDSKSLSLPSMSVP